MNEKQKRWLFVGLTVITIYIIISIFFVITADATTIVTNTATEITDTSVMVNMTLSNLPAAGEQCWIAYSGRGGFYPYNTEHITYTSNGTKNMSIVGYPLLADHTFYYRGECVNGTGNQQSFTLDAAAAITEYNFDRNYDELIAADLNISKLVTVSAKPYTVMFGTMFWGILFSMIFIVGFIRQGETINMSILGILLSAGMMAFIPPEFQNIAQALLIISLTAMVYSIIFKK